MNEKTIKKLKKIIPVSFIVLFAAFLVIPNTGLYRSEKNARLIAQTENRRITPRPTQSLKSKEFYEQFEKWYQDRLRYRDKAIKRWNDFNLFFGIIIKENIVFGEKNFLLDKNVLTNKFNESNEKVSIIKNLQNYCHTKGKDFIVIVPPNKESVYRDYFPKTIQELYKAPEYWHEQAENLFTKNDINYLAIVKPIQEYRKIETHDLYFSDDHHWSYYASSFAADLLLKKLQQDLHQNFYSGLKFDGSTRTAYKECSYANQLALDASKKAQAPWSKEYTDEIYLTDCYTGKTTKADRVVSNDVLWGRIVKGEGIVTNKAAKNNIKLLILGDSYSSYMVPYLSQNVKQIITTHYRDCAEKKKEANVSKLINKYNPDAVILIINESAFFHSSAKNLFKNLKY